MIKTIFLFKNSYPHSCNAHDSSPPTLQTKEEVAVTTMMQREWTSLLSSNDNSSTHIISVTVLGEYSVF